MSVIRVWSEWLISFFVVIFCCGTVEQVCYVSCDLVSLSLSLPFSCSVSLAHYILSARWLEVGPWTYSPGEVFCHKQHFLHDWTHTSKSSFCPLHLGTVHEGKQQLRLDSTNGCFKTSRGGGYYAVWIHRLISDECALIKLIKASS